MKRIPFSAELANNAVFKGELAPMDLGTDTPKTFHVYEVRDGMHWFFGQLFFRNGAWVIEDNVDDPRKAEVSAKAGEVVELYYA